MNSEIIIYESGNHTIEVRLDGAQETLWLSLQQMADLFDRDKSVISRHLRNIFRDEELGRDSVVAKNATTAADGKTYQVDYYNLDAIISVGYRVNSKKGTQFRIWATQRLKEYLVQGYTLNQQRFDKNAGVATGHCLDPKGSHVSADDGRGGQWFGEYCQSLYSDLSSLAATLR